MSDKVIFTSTEDITEVLNHLEGKNIRPEKGLHILIGALVTMLSANGYSRLEMCRLINEAIMTMEEERDPGTIQ